MATKDETNEEQRLQRFHIRQRRAFNNGLAALVGTQSNQTFQAFTFEGTVRVADALPDLRVDRLEEGVWQGAFGDAEDLAGAAGTFAGCRRGECAEALPDAE